jgi:ABC-type multidrug transport system fused ATPase/permease subunit
MQAGRVVERGRQHDLLLINSFYRQMWDLQHQLLR